MKIAVLQSSKPICVFASRFIFAIFALLFFVLPNFAAGGIDPTFSASVTDGVGSVLKTVVQPDGKIVAVGSFQKANGVRHNNLARFNADGTLDTSFNPGGSGANNFIFAVALQADGKILIGGNFTAFNDSAVNRFARLNSDGTLDPTFTLAANFNDSIRDILVQPNGKILVGGAFSAPANQPLASRLVRLNSDGSIDATFINNVTTNLAVYAIAYQTDGKILVGGDFTFFAGAARNKIVRLNNDGSLDPTFDPGDGASDWVNKIIVQPDGKILIAGAFSGYDQEFTQGGLVRLNADGSLATTFSFFFDLNTPTIHAIALQSDGKVVASVFNPDNTPNTHVLRFNPDGTTDLTYGAAARPSFVNAMDLLSNGKLIVGGSFVTYGGQPHLRIARVNADGTVDPDFNAAASSTGTVKVIKRQPNGKILLGGDFEYVNGVRVSSLARLNPDGSLDVAFTPPNDFFGDVFDIELQPDGKMIVGANDGTSDIFPFGRISRLNADGTLDYGFSWTSTLGNIGSIVYQPDGKILMGGTLGVSAFIRVNQNGSRDTTFTPSQPSQGAVREILLQADGSSIIGGTFTLVGGNPRVGTAKYKPNGELEPTYTANVPNVYALGSAADGKIYLGGSFDVGGNRNLTRLTSTGAGDLGFSATANAIVRDLTVQPNGKLIIGGDFTTYNTAPANRVARVNTDGSFDASFNSGAGASGSVHAVELQADGKILVGGQFMDFNGTEKSSLVRLQNSGGLAPFDFDGDSKTDISIFRPSNGEWWYLRSSDGQNRAAQFGNSADKLTPADFTGDGKTDIAVWRPSTGEWFVLRSEDSSYYSFPFGTNGDIPAAGDFDADAKADATIFRPSNGTWYVSRSSGGTTIQQFGQNGDVPVAADYDGDGRADIAIFRPSVGEWWLNRSAAGLIAFQFGGAADKAVQGDYTGDGKADVAIWHPTGEWLVLRSENLSYYSVPFGTAGDVPAPGDYDGDGKFDTSIFRPSSSTWYVQRSTAGTLIQPFGTIGDKPVPGAFVP